MKMYFRKNEEGELILVNDPVPGETYLDAEGNEIVCEERTPEAPAVHITEPIKELTGLIKELASSINDVKEQAEKNVEVMAKAEENKGKAFPLPVGEAPSDESEVKELLAPYEIHRQGIELQNKILHPTHIISDEKREKLAEWFLLFIKATVGKDETARRVLMEKWTPPYALGKAATDNFPVPDIVESEILAFAREKSVLLQDARVVNMISDKQSYPVETAGASVAWGSTVTAGDPTANEVELDTNELSSYSTAKEEVLADARSDIVSWLTESMAEAAGQALDDAGFNGDGSATYGGFSGVMVAAGKSVVLGTGSTSFDKITSDALSQAIAQLDGLRKAGAKWYMNGAVLHYIRTLKDSDNRPIFLQTIGGPVPGQIWGYPYQEVVKMVSTSAANTAFILFGNLRNLMVGRRLDVTTLKVDPYGGFYENTIRYKLYQRWAIKVALADAFCVIKTHA